MRACERGAGPADRAPAHAHGHHTQAIAYNSEQAINRYSGQAIQINNRESTKTHNGETIQNHCRQTTKKYGRKAIKRHSVQLIRKQHGPAVLSHSVQAILPLKHSVEAILPRKHSEEVIIRHSREGRRPRRRSEEVILNSKLGGGSILSRRHGAGGAILLCVLLLLSLRGSCGSASLGAQLVCARAPGLTEKQRALCRASPAAMAAIATGLRMAYAECRSQLSGRRWNCSGVGDSNHFSHVMPLATREAAFTYAITSAGVTHALSAACARGDLPACGCTHRRRAVPGEQWEWGGGSGAGAAATGGTRCGEAAYGARLARRFLDARELERDARALMNLHNNRLGRKLVKELVRRECKCHGVSGSCAVRTCWRALPTFKAVAAALHNKYTRAKMVVPVERGTTVDGQVNIQLVVKRRNGMGAGARVARKSDLVFLAASPTYCEPEPAAGALGTHQRHCNNTSKGEDGCESLCCGRGYSTVRRAERVQCRCQFQWCCRVRCDTCLTRTEYHICN